MLKIQCNLDWVIEEIAPNILTTLYVVRGGCFMSKRKNIGIILIFICSCLLIISLFTLFTKNTTVINSYVPEDKILFTPDDGGEP